MSNLTKKEKKSKNQAKHTVQGMMTSLFKNFQKATFLRQDALTHFKILSVLKN